MAPVYLQYGCGFSVGQGWLNFDSSPTLRIERLPVVGTALGRLAGNAQPFPKDVRYGDITRGLPVAENSVRGVYASHVLEHLALDDLRAALRNTHRVLEPGGIFRLVVPDLEARARRYLALAAEGATDANGTFMRMSHLGLEKRPDSVLGRIRLALGGSAHLWMWDEASLTAELRAAGFVAVRRCAFGDAEDDMFAEVESAGRFRDHTHDLEELALEARKPRCDPAHA